MIGSFGNKLARDLFEDENSKEVRSFPIELHRITRRKLFYLSEAQALQDLKVPPGNRLEMLKGNWAGFHSIRINNQWRIVFRWIRDTAFEVAVLDYHR